MIAIIVLIIEFIILAFFNSMDIEITDGIAIIMIIVYSIVFLGYVTSNKKLRFRSRIFYKNRIAIFGYIWKKNLCIA